MKDLLNAYTLELYLMHLDIDHKNTIYKTINLSVLLFAAFLVLKIFHFYRSYINIFICKFFRCFCHYMYFFCFLSVTLRILALSYVGSMHRKECLMYVALFSFRANPAIKEWMLCKFL